MPTNADQNALRRRRSYAHDHIPCNTAESPPMPEVAAHGEAAGYHQRAPSPGQSNAGPLENAWPALDLAAVVSHLWEWRGGPGADAASARPRQGLAAPACSDPLGDWARRRGWRRARTGGEESSRMETLPHCALRPCGRFNRSDYLLCPAEPRHLSGAAPGRADFVCVRLHRDAARVACAKLGRHHTCAQGPASAPLKWRARQGIRRDPRAPDEA
jgi:hypothetical protein